MKSHYNQHSLSNYRKTPFITNWAYKEGVFLSPNGKYIARVRSENTFKTLSQHEKIEDAQKVYDDFNKLNKQGSK